MSTTTISVPVVEDPSPNGLTPAQAHAFNEAGLLIVRNLIAPAELEQLRTETMTLVEQANAGTDDPDFFFRRHPVTGKDVPFRIEYVAHRSAAARALLGHPFLLGTAQQLQGPNFVPTWDSMVFKNAGAAAAIPWHRDSAAHLSGDAPVFNIDIYLDDADESTCLWGVAGTHRLPDRDADALVAQLLEDGYAQTDGCAPLPMQAGDVLLHNVLAVHGSPAANHVPLRRVLYYEFRPAELEAAVGPHTPDYLPLKQQVVLAALQQRAEASYSEGETPFAYRPTGEFAIASVPPIEDVAFRVAHEDHWRS